MDNQHKKISGYRDLMQEEINLINAIKAKGAELLELQAKLARNLAGHRTNLTVVSSGENPPEEYVAELRRFLDAEPERWANIGKTDIQTGIMALVRAVAQPGGGV